ncbi:hypothetical protein M997_3259 [Proteus hauseri ATCC 700826]|uniref:Uncharacterized protein n=1 Tax=Proteus hauseri ATCC 700826 TaxID=1354271 RepID=A0AAJ3LSI5_PROHU|nr:hypothetical protein M997_3259 [Proteus hauseri ATCC 700826]
MEWGIFILGEIKPTNKDPPYLFIFELPTFHFAHKSANYGVFAIT